MKKKIFIAFLIIATMIACFIYVNRGLNRQAEINKKITYTYDSPPVLISDLLKISENGVKYIYTIYYGNKFGGFLCEVNNKYVMVTKLGKSSKYNIHLKQSSNEEDIRKLIPFDRLDSAFFFRDKNISIRFFNPNSFQKNDIQKIMLLNTSRPSINGTEYYFKDYPVSLIINDSNFVDFKFGGKENERKVLKFVLFKGDLYILNYYK